MKIINPCIELQTSYLSYIEELGNEERYPYPLDLDHSNFAALIEKLTLYSNGKELPDWMVPNTTFWLVKGNEILGCSHLRHCLNNELERAGGHIGLGIRPSARGKGLSKVLLKLTIEQAIAKGIDEIHIHCYKNNTRSARMIESSGAVLTSTITIGSEDKVVMRYVYSS